MQKKKSEFLSVYSSASAAIHTRFFCGRERDSGLRPLLCEILFSNDSSLSKKQKMTNVTRLLRAYDQMPTIPSLIVAEEANCRKLSELAAYQFVLEIKL